MQSNGRDYMEVKTKRLQLRLLQEDDINYLTELNSDPEVRQFLPDGTQNKEQTKSRMMEFISWYEKQGLPCFIIFTLESNEFVGRCGFGPVDTGEIEIGYLLCKKFWGQGLATEAVSTLLDWAKKHIKTEYIIAFAPLTHLASQRVMKKCGMEYYKEDWAHRVRCCFYRIKNDAPKL